MCQVFASTDPDVYRTVTRSVRLDGFSTSIRLEALFWSILDQIAEQEGMSTPRFISTLYSEVLERRGEVGNFTSLLRVTCAVHIERQQGHQPVAYAKQELAKNELAKQELANGRSAAKPAPMAEELSAIAS